MKIGVCLPYMKSGLDRATYLEWFRRIDQGPFDSLSCGERVHGPTVDMRVLLAAAAACTERVEITPTLYVLPMHSAARVAKEVASLQLLAPGRVNRICVGYGGREKDYAAVEAPFEGRYGRMDRQVEALRRVWRGEEIVEGGGPIGPRPEQPEGPDLLAGVLGPKSIRRCMRWANGLYAWSGNGERGELESAFQRADQAWDEAGRSGRPYRLGGFWCSLAENAQQRLHDYVYDYLAIAGHEIAEWMANSVSRSTPDAVREGLDNAEAAGCEEVFLVPATADLAEIDRLAEVVAARR